MDTTITIHMWIWLLVHIVIVHAGTVSIKGKTFSLAYFTEFPLPATKDISNYLYVASNDTGECSVSYNDGFRQTHNLKYVANTMTEYGLPDTTQMSNLGTGVESKAIHINCTHDILLHGFNKYHDDQNYEPFIMLPDKFLSNYYITPSVNQTAFIGIVALYPDTRVSIHLKSTCSYNYKQVTYRTGDVLNITLQHGDVFRLGGTSFTEDDNKCDLAGTIIYGNKIISVFSGALYFQSSKDIGHVVTQVLPLNAYVDTIIVPSVRSADAASMNVRVIANEDHTKVNITSEPISHASIKHEIKIINSAEYFDLEISPDINVIIQSSAPVLVTQFIIYKHSGGSLLTVPGIEQYDNYLLVRALSTAATIVPQVTVVTESTGIQSLRVNGAVPTHITWKNLTTLPYSVGSFPISATGTSHITCSSPMLVRVDEEYGLQSFSYIAGFRLIDLSIDQVKSATTLVCHEGGWEVRMDLVRLQISPGDTHHLYLGTDRCVGTVQGQDLLFNYSYTECNTQTNTMKGMVVYHNTLLFTKTEGNSSLVRDVKWHFDVKCSIPANSSGSIHISPGYSGHGHGEISGSVSESLVHVALFTDSGFTQEVKGESMKAGIGETVYVQVSTRNRNSVMVVHSFYVHLQDDQHVSFPLIENGCEKDRGTHILVSRNQVTRFSFDMFGIKDERDGIYVTCHATFCDPMDFSDKCKQGCKTTLHGAIVG